MVWFRVYVYVDSGEMNREGEKECERWQGYVWCGEGVCVCVWMGYAWHDHVMSMSCPCHVHVMSMSCPCHVMNRP